MKDTPYVQLKSNEDQFVSKDINIRRLNTIIMIALWISKLGCLVCVLLNLEFNVFKTIEYRFLYILAVSIPFCLCCFIAKLDYELSRSRSYLHNAFNFAFGAVTIAFYLLLFVLWIHAEFRTDEISMTSSNFRKLIQILATRSAETK